MSELHRWARQAEESNELPVIRYPLMIVAGVAGLAAAFLLGRAVRRDVRTWSRVVGRVGLYVAPSEGGTNEVVRYEFPEGVVRFTSSVDVGNRSRGDRIHLRVNPDDPSEVVEDTFSAVMVIPAFLALISFALIAVGIAG